MLTNRKMPKWRQRWIASVHSEFCTEDPTNCSGHEPVMRKYNLIIAGPVKINFGQPPEMLEYLIKRKKRNESLYVIVLKILLLIRQKKKKRNFITERSRKGDDVSAGKVIDERATTLSRVISSSLEAYLTRRGRSQRFNQIKTKITDPWPEWWITINISWRSLPRFPYLQNKRRERMFGSRRVERVFAVTVHWRRRSRVAI